eukprot:jgi/Bigna1/127149/aug1.4_g1857
MGMVYDALSVLLYFAIIAAAVAKHSAIGCVYGILFLVLYLCDTFNLIGAWGTARATFAASLASLLAVIGFHIALARNAVKDPDDHWWFIVGIKRKEDPLLVYLPDVCIAVISLISMLYKICSVVSGDGITRISCYEFPAPVLHIVVITVTAAPTQSISFKSTS